LALMLTTAAATLRREFRRCRYRTQISGQKVDPPDR
jgi:hypothetical protein